MVGVLDVIVNRYPHPAVTPVTNLVFGVAVFTLEAVCLQDSQLCCQSTLLKNVTAPHLLHVGMEMLRLPIKLLSQTALFADHFADNAVASGGLDISTGRHRYPTVVVNHHFLMLAD